MKSKVLILQLLILPLLSFSQIYFENTFDFGTFDHPTAVATDEAGNVFVCGWYEDENFENQHAFAFKVDANGQEVWRNVTNNSSKFYNMCIMASGDIALAGGMAEHCYLQVVNPETGIETWTYEEDASDGFWFGTVNEMPAGSLSELVAAKTKDSLHTPVIYNISSSIGKVKAITPWMYEVDAAIQQSYLQAYDYMWFGVKDVAFAYDNDNHFRTVWSFGASYNAGMDRYTPDSWFLIRTLAGDSGVGSIGLLSTDFIHGGVDGNWIDFSYPGAMVLGSGALGFEKIMITGSINGDLALWLVDTDLNLQDEITYPVENERTGVDVLGLASNDLLMMGFESPGDGSSSDVFLMKRDANGGVVSTPEIITNKSVQVYPNPAKDRIYIKNTHSLNVEVDVMNSLGQLVKKIRNSNQYISVEDLPKGYYLAVIKIDGMKMRQEKLLVQ
jgi:hypothetical protein